MTYEDFLRRQWQDLLDAWLGLDPAARLNTAYIALPGIEWVKRLEEPRFPGCGGVWEQLPSSVSPNEALLRRDASGRPQLWVRPEEKEGEAAEGRYATHWATFLRCLGMPAARSEAGGRKLAIDHLFPETAAARRGWALVRVMPVDLRSNSLVGSTAEKAEAGKAGRPRPRTASWQTIAKVTAFQGSFAKRHEAAAIAAALHAHLGHCGLAVPPQALLARAVEEEVIAHGIEFHRR